MNLIDDFIKRGFADEDRPSREEVEEALIGWAMLHGDAVVDVLDNDKWKMVLWGRTQQEYIPTPLKYVATSDDGKYDTMQMNDIGKEMLDEILNR